MCVSNQIKKVCTDFMNYTYLSETNMKLGDAENRGANFKLSKRIKRI